MLSTLTLMEIIKYLRESDEFSVFKIFYHYKCKKNTIIQGISNDTRQLQKADLYIAIKGYQFKGYQYVLDAYKKGVRCFIVETSDFNTIMLQMHNQNNIMLIGLLNTRKALALLAACYYQFSSQFLKVVGITGTNGKTTTSYLLKEIVKGLGYKVALVGTLGIFIDEKKIESKLTTPESIDLQKILYQMREEKVEYLFIELSSHALFLDRVFTLELDALVFTSFSQDHLDFHENMEAYFEAKLKALELLSKSRKKNKLILFNASIDESWKNIFLKKLEQFKLKIKFYGIKKTSNEYVQNQLNLLNMDIMGSQFKLSGFSKILKHFFENRQFKTSLLGTYNLENLLAALSILDHLKILSMHKDKIFKLCELLNVPGRYEMFQIKQKKTIAIIDYAHTARALKSILFSIYHDLKKKNIICIFGCGGNRDRKKRALMGKWVAHYSSSVIITNDNPRSESPDKIVQDILEGIPKKFKFLNIILDREKAIERGINLLEKDSILLIAGKGHETQQIFAKHSIYFNDAEILKKYIDKL